MKIIHNIGEKNNPNYTSREKILACNDDLSFDGIYLNIYENKDVLKTKLDEGRKIILYWTSDYIGGNNDFDVKNPFNGAVVFPEKFTTMEQLLELEALGCELGWHTKSHRDLTKLSREEQIKEITPPFKMRTFAYTYGKWNQQIIDIVKSCGFEKAVSVERTDGTQWTIPRTFI